MNLEKGVACEILDQSGKPIYRVPQRRGSEGRYYWVARYKNIYYSIGGGIRGPLFLGVPLITLA